MQSRAEVCVHVYTSRHGSLFALNIFRRGRINLIAGERIRKRIISKNNFRILGAKDEISNGTRSKVQEQYKYIYFLYIFRIKSFVFVSIVLQNLEICVNF